MNSEVSELNNNNLVSAGEVEEKPATANANWELCAKLTRRLDINEGLALPKQAKYFNAYTEFKEFSRTQIKDMDSMFKQCPDVGFHSSKLRRIFHWQQWTGKIRAILITFRTSEYATDNVCNLLSNARMSQSSTFDRPECKYAFAAQV
ncbi:EF-hand domain-containing protein D1 [Acipenser ruthenus]|uniref:EF-hand domain-containing protein D1 n=1 Tax=Acipenser ruthenus TaxID=7906 RepID=A0A444UZA9_ACIRT|nr:EF-hand domain-containing protein D1 [Acipenser ruthenus]